MSRVQPAGEAQSLFTRSCRGARRSAPPLPFPCRCPACRAFQPAYVEIAGALAARGTQAPRVAVARLDCADHAKVCTAFAVTSYPTMWLGTAQQLAAQSTEGLTRVNPSERSKEGVLKELEKLLGA